MTQKADPGIGRESAPIGSRAWAERVRLNMQGIVSQVHTKPDLLRDYVDLVKSHQAWTLMNRPDGSFFSSWEEFCAHRQPWGLGKPWAELRPFIEAAAGKAVVAACVAQPAPTAGGKRKGAGRKTASAVSRNQSYHDNADSGRGTDPDYLASRIARDAPAIHEEMKAGKYPSVRAAAKAAGIVKDPDPVTVAVRALKRVPAHRLGELRSRLSKEVVAALCGAP